MASHPATVRPLVLGSLLLATVVIWPLFAPSGANLAASMIQIAASETESVETGTTTVQLDATDAYRFNLLKIKGQLSVARALLQLRAAGVDYHLGQPLHDIFRDAEAELDRRGAPFTVDILPELANAAKRDPVQALATVELAVNAVNGSFAQTGAMDAASVLDLAEALMREAVANYAAAVADNEVVDLPKYQSGRGFVTEAEALIRHSSQLKGKPGHTKLLDVVTLIRQAWPGVIPPPIVFDPKSVAERLDQAVAIMEELQ